MAEIESMMRYEKQHVTVHGKQMAYVDTGGSADPIVFLHGNITQSYMWRNIIPHVEPVARCIAVDNIGQGDSDKRDAPGPGSYRLEEHQRYIDGFLDEVLPSGRVTLMMHDWGVQLGLSWGNKNRGRVKGVAHMQGLMGDPNWGFWSEEVSVMKGHVLERVREFPNQTEVTVSGLHYVQEDSPHEIGAALADWYRGLD